MTLHARGINHLCRRLNHHVRPTRLSGKLEALDTRDEACFAVHRIQIEAGTDNSDDKSMKD